MMMKSAYYDGKRPSTPMLIHGAAKFFFLLLLVTAWLLTNYGYLSTDTWKWLGPLAVLLGVSIIMIGDWYKQHPNFAKYYGMAGKKQNSDNKCTCDKCACRYDGSCKCEETNQE